MLSYKQSLDVFKDYLKAYDIDDSKVKLKIEHTYSVVSLSEMISKSLELSNEQVELAKIIALFHDIGRFEQLKQTSNFTDSKNTDHANLAIHILYDKNFMRKFISTDKFDSIISKAILNHNKLEIENGLSTEELLQAKILRDADKLDNFRVCSYNSFEEIFNFSQDKINNSIISDDIYNTFMNNKCISYEDIKTDLDYWISAIAFIYDFNYLESFKYLKEKDYINKMIDRINCCNEETKQKMNLVNLHAQKYLEQRIKILEEER